MSDEIVSARGERAAMGGYMPQFREFAWLTYQAMVSGTLEWIRIADPDAQKLDDIQYSTTTHIHAYQVKWSIAGAVVSFTDFKNLFAGLVESWQHLCSLERAQGKQVTGHLLTNKPFSVNDKVLNSAATAGTFSEFYTEVWLKIQQNQPYDDKWKESVEELRALTNLELEPFKVFVQQFFLHPLHPGQLFSITRVMQSQEDADLNKLLAYLLEQVSDPTRRVEFTKPQLSQALGWEDRFRTTFNHELIVDKKKYQPLTSTIATLDAKILEHQGGYLFLAGGPGSGKSTLLTEWARSRRDRVIRYYAFNFLNPSSWENTDERGDSTHLFFDLVLQLKAAGFYPKEMLPYMDFLFLRRTFEQQLLDIVEDFKRTGRKTVLIIDGLDHVPREYSAAAKSFLRDLPQPATLPEGVYIILGSQSYELQDLRPEIKTAWQRGDRSVHIEPMGREEVYKYIEANQLVPPLTAAQKEVLYEKSQGHPLYLSYLCERLQNGESVDQTLAETIQIDGNISEYYNKIWIPIENNSPLVNLLGLLARINGAINPKFIHEWGFLPAVFREFDKNARFLFGTAPSGWSFFHNSFRQFLLQHTALDYLLGTSEVDKRIDASYHRQLAGFYAQSEIEQPWSANYHLYRAGENEQFVVATTPENLGQQLLDFRPAEEIKRDIELGVQLARQTNNVALLSRYLFALSELNHRLSNIYLPGLVKEFLDMGKPDVVRRYLRNGRTLRVSKGTALRAAGLFQQYGDPVEASILFSIAEPEIIKDNGIIVQEIERFEDAENLLEAWASVALHFHSVSGILTRLSNVQLVNSPQHWAKNETAERLRLNTLETLALSAVELHKWEAAKIIKQALTTGNAAEQAMLPKVLQEEIEECRRLGNEEGMRQHLAELLAIFDLENSAPATKIFVANLIYKASGDLTLVESWITGIAQPIISSRDLRIAEHGLNQFAPLIILNKLQHIIGKGEPITVAVPIEKASSKERLVLEFQRRLCLISQLQAVGTAQSPSPTDIISRVRPIVHFYYQTHERYDSDWFQLTNLKGSYFEFLVVAVAQNGQQHLQNLADYLFGEFAANEQYWYADVKRRVLMSLYDEGIEDNIIAPHLQELESKMFVEDAVSTRVDACIAQAKAWLRMQNAEGGKEWLRRGLIESFGVGYRKDYQFNTWLEWLQRLIVAQPEQAQERLLWFVARLQHLKETTEGRAYWYASEKLLEITLDWNFAAGQKLLCWQLEYGRIHAEQGLEKLIVGYLNNVQKPHEYGNIVRLYADFFLLIAVAADTELLEKLLVTGANLLGEQFFRIHLPGIIEAVERHALQETRAELFTALDQFVVANGYRTDEFYPPFVLPANPEQENRSSSNELVLKDDHGRLSEAEVLARISSYEDLLSLVQQESPHNSYFKWQRVLERVGGSFSREQLAALSESVPRGTRKAEFLAVLSGFALQLGDRDLASRLAQQSALASAETGWMKYFDGGSRLSAFAALKAADPIEGPRKAFEAFAHDALSGDLAGSYVENLDDILPLLTQDLQLESLWPEVFGYLQRLMLASQPLELLPDIKPEPLDIDKALAELLTYLALHQLTFVQQRARQLLAAFIEQGDVASLDCLLDMASQSGPEAEAFVEILLLLPAVTRQALATKELKIVLQELAVSTDYWIRRQSRWVLTEANLPLPNVPARQLPGVYSLRLNSPKTLLTTLNSDTATRAERLSANMDLIRPFNSWLSALAEESGIEEETLAHRMVALMHSLDNPANWTSKAENELWAYMQDIGLKYAHPKPRVEAARRALMQVVTELLDSDTIAEEPIYRLFTFRDYQVYSFPEAPKPSVIQALGRHEHSEWIAEAQDNVRLAEALVPYSPEQLVIGEYTMLRGMTWGGSTETYEMQLATDDQVDDDDDYIFGSVFQRLTADYPRLTPKDRVFVIIRDHRLNQFDLKSKWLAFNPWVAQRLGWKHDPQKLFAWRNGEGDLMVESIYWADGNMNTQPYHGKSEAGEGWLVLASTAAVEQLNQLAGPLFIGKKITRSRWRDGQHEEATVRATTSLEPDKLG